MKHNTEDIEDLFMISKSILKATAIGNQMNIWMSQRRRWSRLMRFTRAFIDTRIRTLSRANHLLE